MEQDLRKLPSFKSLTVIAAVVRHQNFTAASQELRVTPSAVSKQVAQIEAWLGLTLFERHGGAALPRPEARRLAESVEVANGVLLDAVAAIRPEPPRGTLRVAAPATFAMRWLIPRLWTFSSRHPGVSVDVKQTHACDTLASIEYDVAIRQTPPFPPETQPRRVLTDALGLVMAPQVLRSRRPGSLDLSRVDFLESESRPGELDRWLDAAALQGIRPTKRWRFPHFYIALEAALSGQGALVAPVATIADLLAQGHLCEPFKTRRVALGNVVAFSAPRQDCANTTKPFLDWLVETGERSG